MPPAFLASALGVNQLKYTVRLSHTAWRLFHNLFPGATIQGSRAHDFAMAKATPDEKRPIGTVRRRRLVAPIHSPGRPRLWNAVGIVLGVFFTLAGVMHFVNLSFFDEIVPPWLWPSERFWTYASGVGELVVGLLIIVPRTRRIGSLAAIVGLIAVYPANLYMTWDWRDRVLYQQFVSWARLPFQFVFMWAAWMVARSQPSRHPRA